MLNEQQISELRQSNDGRNRIAKAMALADITQVQLAERTGFTQSYISKLKNGDYRSDLPGETMRLIAMVFGCAIEDVFPSTQAVA